MVIKVLNIIMHGVTMKVTIWIYLMALFVCSVAQIHKMLSCIWVSIWQSLISVHTLLSSGKIFLFIYLNPTGKSESF